MKNLSEFSTEEINFLEKVTLVIPTYNSRIEYLKRLLDYYSDTPIKIIVYDSSEKAFPYSEKYDIVYIHKPNMEYRQKLLKAVSLVKTEYVILCGDDDFAAPSGIIKGVEFLENNKDYSCVAGCNLNYFFDKGKVKFAKVPYVLQSCEYDTIAKRLEYLPGYEILYALHKTEILRDVFEFGTKIKFNILWEYVNYMHTVIKGKVKAMPIILSVREYAFGINNHREKNIVYVRSHEKKEFEKYVQFITNSIKEKENMKSRDIRRIINKSIDNHEAGVQKGKKDGLYRKIRYNVLMTGIEIVDFFSENLACYIKKKYGLMMIRKRVISQSKAKGLFKDNYYELEKIKRGILDIPPE